jgi:hypothetical protein
MSVLVSRLDPGSDAYRANCSAKLRLLEEFAAQSRVGDLKRQVLATGAWHRAVALPLGEGEGHRRLRRVPDVITKGLVANRGKLTREGRTADTFMGRSRRPNSSAAHGDRLDCEQLAFGLLPNGDGRLSSKASLLSADDVRPLSCDQKWIDRGDPMMWVSHETIYQALYVQGRGERRRELARCLRTGRAKRHPRGRVQHTGQLRGMVMISQRPAEADDRAVPGHWEGDLLIGTDYRSAVATLVERTTRYVLLLHLPAGRDAHLVEQAMRKAITTLPGQLARTITWDQGKEMAYHAHFTIATGIPVSFCDPHKPWQRGSNENTNRLLRQYLPKAPTCRCTPPLTLLASPVASTTGPARPSAT